MQFITRPNLPQSSVKLMAITSKEPILERILLAFGIETVLVGSSPALHKPVDSHPDLLLHHLGEKYILLAEKSVCDEEKLRAHGFFLQVAQSHPEAAYPSDIPLCTVQLGPYAFGSKLHTAPELLSFLENTNVRFLHVRQGYARCSACVIAQNAIATADPSVQRAAETVGIDCLKVPAGEILLQGYDYGFLGGCCGLLAPDVLGIYGNAAQLSYYETFKRFAAKHGVKLLSLRTDILPTDIGTMIPLLCEQ